jgi:hypothetical protein
VAEHHRFGLALLFAQLLVAGCSGPPASPPFEPEAYRGVVDESLSPEQQQRQQVIIDLFYELQMSRDFQDLPEVLPHIRFTETREQFLEGMLDLHRWQFAGPPNGAEVPLRLFFREDKEPDYPERQFERVYIAEKTDETWIVRRHGSI